MEEKKNKYVAVAYKLYTTDENGSHLVEETKEGQPFSFISGFGFALDKQRSCPRSGGREGQD